MKRYCISTSLLLVLAIGAFAQKHDYVWVMGRDKNQFIPGGDANVLDFNFDPVDIYYVSNNMNHFRLNAGICDAEGNLLYYTNGVFIADFNHEPVQNGDGLNPSQLTNDFANDGLTTVQGAMFLPYPGQDSMFIMLHTLREWSGLVSPNTYTLRLYYSLIDQRLNNHRGRVIEKNALVIEDTLETGKITTVRHANGRDWWSLVQKRDTNLYYRILIDDKGIALQAPQEVDNNVYSGAGQAVFSPDGSKYVHYTLRSLQLGHFIYVYDFDRCSGILSNQRVINFLDDEIFAGGAAISPNSRYLYISANRYVFQFDLWADDIAATKDTVAVYDGYESPFPTSFYYSQLAPDGKIYINCTNGVDVLHVINNPDLPGMLCDVCQHCVQLPTYNPFSLPNFPNYRLHHLEGSPCDTLRQPPVAEWVHEPLGLEVGFHDASYHDIRAWHWSFGDGVTDTVPNPVHSYAAEGVYNVCLSVSNPRGADTLCREVQVLVSSAGFGSAQPAALKVEIWPNPLMAGQSLNISGRGILPNSTLILQDVLGRKIHRETLYPAEGMPLRLSAPGNLPPGVYFYRIETGTAVYAQGKMVIQ